MGRGDTAKGVENMLRHCGGVAPGDRLLIAYEPPEHGYFEKGMADELAAGARQMGLHVDAVDVGFAPHTKHLPEWLLTKIADVDVVVFLARLGDQLRFSEMPQGTTLISSFTLNQTLLSSGFSTAHYDAFMALKKAVDRRIANAHEITITCPAGTHVQGFPNLKGHMQTDTTLKRFPISVFSPVPAAGFSGQVALCGFLTGTGSQYYDDYTVEFEGQVFANLSKGQLTGFDGSRSDVDKAVKHYDRVSHLCGTDRNFVHSWHAGIHPGCGYWWDARDNYDRWGGAAFGNPRLLHFHTCGAFAPGEISWNVVDPTIDIDGDLIWENGQFHAERLDEGPDILNRYSCAAACFDQPVRSIGLPDHP